LQDDELEELHVERLRGQASSDGTSISSDDILLNNNEIDHDKLMKLLNNENNKLQTLRQMLAEIEK
jgi:hypothetical protein